MLLKYPLVKSPNYSSLPNHHHQKKKLFFKILCCDKNASSSSSSSSSKPHDSRKLGFKLVGQSLGDFNWNFNDIYANGMQESVNQWLTKTQSFFNGVTSPLVKSVNEKLPILESDVHDVEDFIITEQTVDSRTPRGELSEAAIISIEQFSRMNGLTGRKMQRTFKTLVPESVYSDSRYLVEHCCFRFLSKNGANIHPSLKEPAFQRLIFITMLAWENPYTNRKDNKTKLLEKNTLQKKHVGEEAFVRFAPAVPGVADYPTVHNLFKALAGDDGGISFHIWSTYINELLKVYEGRKSFQFQELSNLSKETISQEKILCLGSGRKQPVIRWEKNMAWPGKLILTDKTLHFEAAGLMGKKDAMSVDLTSNGSRVEKARVGPFESNLFDSAISVTSGQESERLVLEFVDLGGDMRRDVWYTFIKEVIAVYQFIREYGPKDGDESVHDIYGAHKGKERAITYAAHAIARLQALQFMKRTLDEPTKLVPFSYLQSAPYGEIVLQTLAVNFWGGPIVKVTEGESDRYPQIRPSSDVSQVSSHAFDIDGSVYLRKWMRSGSWGSNASLAFWKNTSSRKGVVLSKDLVVADMTLVEKAAMTCRDKFKVAEKTQATIDAAMIEGIPSNIDLFKELVLPITLTAKNFERLRRWDDPLVTASFLGLLYTLVFRNLLSYVFPVTLMFLSTGMLLLKGLKEQGRLGRFFGKVIIHDQAPSNTIQKIIAVKEAMREVEKYLQNVNVVLLKIRSILLAGNPQITTEVALVLLLGSTSLFIVPFKYIIACLIFDLFTRELEFRREMVVAFNTFLSERWNAVPAAPVVVLPFEEGEKDSGAIEKDSGAAEKKLVDKEKSERSRSNN